MFNGPNIPWTEQEEKILTEMAKAGAFCDDIAAVLKARNRNSVKMKAKALGLNLSGPSPEIDMEAFKKFMKGVK